jgi:hypothetical protein
MLERGGQIRARVIDDNSHATLMPNIEQHVEKGSHYSDHSLHSANILREGFV